MISPLHIDILLSNTKRIIAHQRVTEKLKGETFNVFSILKMERKENDTHSAFLAELLNPDGSHLKGNIFLQLFLNCLDFKTQLDIKTAKVKVEHNIGGRDDVLKKGGRIDIFIYDKNYNCISIENKIDAGDQFAQVERYCNYKTTQNTVIYLNKFGEEPSLDSKGNLESGTDFFILSYKHHIINWLENCIKEAADAPILRESIKQYLILLKKMTNSMDEQEKQEMNALIAKHFEEADYIKHNVDELKKQIGEEVRTEVIKLCQERFKEEFVIFPGNNTNYKFSQIWLKFKDHQNANLFFGIESFSYLLEEEMYVGILNDGGEPNDFKHGDFIGTPWWPYYSVIDNFENHRVYFDDYKTLEKLFFDKEFRNRFEVYLVDEIEKFVNIYKGSLLEYLDKQNV